MEPGGEEKKLARERWRLLRRLERLLDLPMTILGFVWLALIILESTRGLSRGLERVSIGIWVLFGLDFLLSLFVAPDKKRFLKRNVLTMLSLVAPVLRVFRLLRLVRMVRGIRLVRLLGSLNRGIGSLSATMRRRAAGYVALVSAMVVFGGAAGIYAFENRAGEAGLNTYPEALWWTAMIVLTIGSEYWPRSTEGRILCYLLALYGFAALGYVTATLATFFIGQDEKRANNAAATDAITELRRELRELRELLRDRRKGDPLA